MQNHLISISVKCPACGKSLMDEKHNVDNKPGIKLNIRIGNNSGIVWLSPLYGSYALDSDIELVENEIAEFSCPHCKTKLTSDELCESCKAPLTTVILDMGGKVNFCSRKGCKKHSVEFEDLSLALKNFYADFDSYSNNYTH